MNPAKANGSPGILSDRTEQSGIAMGVVLAGGRSSRMGHDKAGLLWKGRTWLDHAAGLLRDAGLQRILVSGAPSAGHSSAEDVAFVPDRRDLREQGPLAGLASIFPLFPGDFTLVVIPVDMPLLEARLVRELLRTSHDLDAAHYRQQTFPLQLHVSSGVREALSKALAEPDTSRRSVKAFLERIRCLELSLSAADQPCFRNLNTPLERDELEGVRR